MTSSMKEQLLEALKRLSYKTGDFTLSSGAKSNYIIDCKKTILSARGHELVGVIINDIITLLNTPIQYVAGVELGGCPIASAVSTMCWRNSIDALYIRKTPKEHGSKNLIEGYYETGKSVVLVEDVITSGTSSINALQVLKDASLNVVAVICLVDRQEGGKEAIQERFGLPVMSLYTVKDFQ